MGCGCGALSPPPGLFLGGGEARYVIYKKRKYKVHYEKCRKYIIVRGTTIHLGTIRGKYKYT